MLSYAAQPQKGIYQKQYRAFRGVDMSSGLTEVDTSRSPQAPNMISDQAGFPEKRPGYRSIFQVGANWCAAGETWTYASASSFTVSGDRRARYQTGYAVKFNQDGTTKMGVIASSNYVNGITAVFLTEPAFSDAAITNPYYINNFTVDSGWVKCSIVADKWVYKNSKAFTVFGDRTTRYRAGYAVKFDQNWKTNNGLIDSSIYANGITTVTLTESVLENAAITNAYYKDLGTDAGWVNCMEDTENWVYANKNAFTVSGDKTLEYIPGYMVKCEQNESLICGSVQQVSYYAAGDRTLVTLNAEILPDVAIKNPWRKNPLLCALGWTTAGEDWSYASANSFTVSGDKQTKYTTSTLLKFDQDGIAKTAKVGLSTCTGGQTTVTLTSNILANTGIVNPYYSYDTTVYGIFSFVSDRNAMLVAHVGTRLYSFPVMEVVLPENITDITPEGVSMNKARSTSFVMRSSDKTINYKLCLYILDGVNYLRYGGNGVAVPVETAAHVPTTNVASPPAGGGAKKESMNLLQPMRRNQFLGDTATFNVSTMTSGSATVVLSPSNKGIKEGMMITGTNVPDNTTISAVSLENATITMSQSATGSRTSGTVTIGSINYYLDTYPVDSINLVEQLNKDTGKWDPVSPSAYSLAYDTKGCAYVKFTTYREAAVGGIDNIRVTFTKTVAEYPARIKNCTIAAFYGIGSDNRIFLSGNPNYRNYDWQSGIANPEYFPDDGYAVVGSENSAIMGYLKEYDSLVIVKEDNDQDASLYLRTSMISEDGTQIAYPLKQGLVGVGAISKYAFGVLADDPVFLSKGGIFGLESSAITSQRTVQLRSYYVNGSLLKETALNTACAAIWNGWYCLFVNGRAYVANSRQVCSNMTGSQGYEWFYWEDIPAVCCREYGGSLYFGTPQGDICRFTPYAEYGMSAYWDAGVPYACRWSTKMDDLGDFMRQKTILKRGVGIIAKPYVLSSGTVYFSNEDTQQGMASTFGQNLIAFDFGALDFSKISFNPVNNPRVTPIKHKLKDLRLLQVIVENAAGGTGFGIYGIQIRYIFTKDVKK